MEKNDKKNRNSENKIMDKMKIFLGCEWWDNFCVWNGLRLDWVELKICEGMEVSWIRSNKNKRIKNKWKMQLK
jgi:hypothetical protein